MKKLTLELIATARAAKSAEELIALAKENNVEITETDAKIYFEQLNANGALSDEELDVVAGGCGGEEEKKEEVKGTSLKSGDRVKVNSRSCATCGWRYGNYSPSFDNFYTVFCERCGSIIITSFNPIYIQKA